eukprot:10809126-Alexandrium_andersonii.AAC.1
MRARIPAVRTRAYSRTMTQGSECPRGLPVSVSGSGCPVSFRKHAAHWPSLRCALTLHSEIMQRTCRLE